MEITTKSPQKLYNGSFFGPFFTQKSFFSPLKSFWVESLKQDSIYASTGFLTLISPPGSRSCKQPATWWLPPPEAPTPTFRGKEASGKFHPGQQQAQSFPWKYYLKLSFLLQLHLLAISSHQLTMSGKNWPSSIPITSYSLGGEINFWDILANSKIYFRPTIFRSCTIK